MPEWRFRSPDKRLSEVHLNSNPFEFGRQHGGPALTSRASVCVSDAKSQGLVRIEAGFLTRKLVQLTGAEAFIQLNLYASPLSLSRLSCDAWFVPLSLGFSSLR